MARSDQNGMTNAAGIAYGELIRRQRKEKKMNQEELGALVKVGKNAVGAWEAGRSRPDVGSVPVICEALGLSLEESQKMMADDPEQFKECVRASLRRQVAAINRLTAAGRLSGCSGTNWQHPPVPAKRWKLPAVKRYSCLLTRRQRQQMKSSASTVTVWNPPSWTGTWCW